jgi:hypothetical protein
MGVLQSGGGSRADADRARRLEQLMQQKESQLDALAARLQVVHTAGLGCFWSALAPACCRSKSATAGPFVFPVQHVEKEEAKRALEMQLRSAGTEVRVCAGDMLLSDTCRRL